MAARRLGRVAAICAVAMLGLVGCAPDIATVRTRLEPYYRMQQPAGSGPFPALLLVPDCGGIGPARLHTAAELVGRGYVVVFVDYPSARGPSTGPSVGLSTSRYFR